MGPLIYIAWPGFDGLVPFAVAQNAGHPTRSKHSHYLVHWNLACILHDNKVNEIVTVRERGTRIPLDGDRAIDALLMDVASRLGNFGRVRFESVNRIAIIGAQSRRQCPVTTAKVDNDTALYTGGIENLPGHRYCIIFICLCRA